MPTEKIPGTYRPDLSLYAMEFVESQQLIGTDIFLPFDVEEEKGKYPVMPIEALLNVPETRRAPRTCYARNDWEFELADYDTDEQGVEEPVDDIEAKKYERFFDAELIATQAAINAVVLNREKSIANTLFDPVAFTPHGVSTEWSNPAATVKSDILQADIALHNACGAEGFTLVVTMDTFNNLTLNNEIL